MAKAKSKAKRDQRHERRFYPHSSANPKVVGIVGAIGAMLAGAGAYGQFGPMHEGDWLKIVPWLLAVGAALIGGAFWFGTSGEPTLRVGDGGIAVEKGNAPRRMPWFAHTVSAGQMIIMPANIPHELKAVKPFKMLLVMIRA